MTDFTVVKGNPCLSTELKLDVATFGLNSLEGLCEEIIKGRKTLDLPPNSGVETVLDFVREIQVKMRSVK